MDVLVEELEHSAEDLIVSVNNYKKYVRKMEDIEDMSAEEIFQVSYYTFNRAHTARQCFKSLCPMLFFPRDIPRAILHAMPRGIRHDTSFDVPRKISLGIPDGISREVVMSFDSFAYTVHSCF